MNTLYAYHSSAVESKSPDIVLWKKLYSTLITVNSSYIDRTNTIQLPINVEVPEFLALPKFDPLFNKSYKECCQARVKDILAFQESTDKPIQIMYSGGIDSSLVLASFIDNIGLDNCAKRIQLVMSNLSREENPTMWEKFIRRSNIPLINSFDQRFQVNRNAILVTGELNDQLFHLAASTAPINHWASMSQLLEPWSVSKLVDYFVWAKLETAEAEHLANLLKNLATHAEFEIYSLWDLFWYLNFTGRWASCYFQNFLTLTRHNNDIDKEAVTGGYLRHFFDTKEFQLWAMINKEHKHKGTLDSTKWYPRQLVADFLNDSGYLGKSKHGSLYHLIRGNNAYHGLDSNFNFVDPTYDKFYNPVNSFKT